MSRCNGSVTTLGRCVCETSARNSAQNDWPSCGKAVTKDNSSRMCIKTGGGEFDGERGLHTVSLLAMNEGGALTEERVQQQTVVYSLSINVQASPLQGGKPEL